MSRRWFMAIAVVMMAGMLLAPACGGGGGGGGSSHSLVGVWTTTQSNVGGEVGKVWVFSADGTGLYGGWPITYSYSGGTLYLNATGIDVPFSVSWLSSTQIQIINQTTGEWDVLERS